MVVGTCSSRQLVLEVVRDQRSDGTSFRRSICAVALWRSPLRRHRAVGGIVFLHTAGGEQLRRCTAMPNATLLIFLPTSLGRPPWCGHF